MIKTTCNKCNSTIYFMDGEWTGIKGIYAAIKWLGFRDWLHCSWVRHCLADEREVYNAKSGN